MFSQYFLQEGIQKTQDWLRLTEDTLNPYRQAIKAWLEHAKSSANLTEADTERELIEPILNILGFHYLKQRAINEARQNVPDYILFVSEEDKEKFRRAPHQGWHNAVAILEAKRWERNLDRSDKTDPSDPSNPSSQILRYLSVAEVKSDGKVLWGILTNGRLWRLYYHKAIPRIEGFIEFDLWALTHTDSPEAQHYFKVFYLLFRKEAFIPVAWRPHYTFHQIALEEGKRWEKRVTETLHDKIFTEIFPEIARGFIHNARLKGKTVDEQFIEKVYQNTLIFLYRLLFLLYAEDRDLLPVRDERYQEYSLSRIRNEIAQRATKQLSKIASTYYDRLKHLFRIIGEGDRELGIPPYNGGLFSSADHPFLEEYAVPDAFLVPALDRLSRDYSEHPPRRINYRDLSVRQLGSIYEGLLEFKLRVADQNLTIRRQNGREVYAPANNRQKVYIPKGEVYLTNDRRERKASGSYYTPDYIVQYIVRYTLEVHITKAIAEFDEWRALLQKTTSKTQLKKWLQDYNLQFDPKKYNEKGEIIGEKSLNEYKNFLLGVKDPVNALLSLKILDPAMGSGHFLVAAVDYLADRIMEILHEISGKEYFKGTVYQSPIVKKLHQIRQKILLRARQEGYQIDESKLEDKNLIKRIILKRCIYGVDVNPLAVELAKVSLWLHTFTIGAPLSFLDHHLKCGNALIGADLTEVRRVLASSLMGQYFAQAFSVIETVHQLQELADADITEVEESARLYREVAQKLCKLKKALDLYTAEFFTKEKRKAERYREYIFTGNNRNANNNRRPPMPWAWHMMETYDPLKVVEGELETSSGTQPMNESQKEQLSQRLQIAQTKHFFHWELEFPEIWYDSKGQRVNGGFHIVMGNPPYVRIQEMRRARPDEVEYHNLFYTTPTGSYDLYVLFIEKGLRLLHRNGILGYIVPNKFTKLDYGERLRHLITPYLHALIDFGDHQVFPEQTTYTGLLFLDKRQKDRVRIARAPRQLHTTLAHWLNHAQEEMYEVDIRQLGSKPWILVPKKEMAILHKMEKRSIPLARCIDRIIVGIQTSADEIYILEKLEEMPGYYRVYSRASSKELLIEKGVVKPLVSGEDIERYYVKTSSKLLLFPYRLLPEGGAELIPESDFRTMYPNAWQYLKEHEEALRNRERGKMKNRPNWYGYVYPKNLDKHEQPKLGVPRLCNRLKTFFDESGTFYFDNVDVNGILLKADSALSPFFLLAVLNSKIMDWRFKKGSVPFRGGFFSANKQFLEPLPIPTINFNTQDKKELDNLLNLYQREEISLFKFRVRELPPDSAVLHDLLVHLAREMAQLAHKKHLLERFLAGELVPGSQERIAVVELLEKHPAWKNSPSETFQKELAQNLTIQTAKQLHTIDDLIDYIVCHLYGLTDGDTKLIL